MCVEKVRESKHFELNRIKVKGFEKGCLIFTFFDVLLNFIYETKSFLTH